MTEHHTVKAFDSDLQELARMVAEMGGLAERQVADAVDARKFLQVGIESLDGVVLGHR